MKKITLLSLTMLMCIASFAQSPYQTKCFEIYKKYMRIISAGTISPAELENVFNTYVLAGLYPYDYESARTETAFAAAELNYMLKYPTKIEDLRNKMKAEFEAAKSLMREDDKMMYKVNTEMRVPYGKVKWEGARQFLNWTNKGEFETTAQWDNRLKNQSRRVFDSIMIWAIQKELDKNYWYLDFGNYNADKEELKIYFKDKSGKNGISHDFKLSPQDAQNIKYNITLNSDDLQLYEGGAGFESRGKQKLQMWYYYWDICYIDDEDASFCPSAFVIKYNGEKTLFDNKERWNAVKDVTYNFDDLGIELTPLKGYVFSYKQAYDDLITKGKEAQQKKEQAIKDSIAKVEERRINDSIALVKQKEQEELNKRNDLEYMEKSKPIIAQIDFLDPSQNTSSLNAKREELLEFAKQRKGKPYYITILNTFINSNNAMKKEYTKNGSKYFYHRYEKFTDAIDVDWIDEKSDFFDAYTSGNYKAIIQSKK
ncbi:MAG: hypothetical protein J6Z01_08935 [Bacteroidales bacterium]|nr:hypothetical protein [Bacteroidales bacterium]